jgi:hypothetical protein
VRYVRMLGVCLAAAFVLAAIAASSALALKNPTKSLKIFANCPVNGMAENGLPDSDCVFGATEAPEGGQFTVGPITVPLAKQITLQYGIAIGEPPEDEEFYIAPTHGAEAIAPTPEKVPGEPIAHISATEQEELGWPESLKYSYAQAQKHHTVKTVYETIEQAGNNIHTSIDNILTEKGNGVEVGVKIKGENRWLSQLGDVCYIGSTAEPIMQDLTSGESTSPLTGETVHGTRGEIEFSHEASEAIETHSDLVDNTYAVPGASCTGPYAAFVSATIDREFGIPAVAGASVTELKGTLYLSSKEVGEEGGA